MPDFVPKISSKFFCVCRLKDRTLAAIVSSYLMQLGEYTPIFGFPEVTAEKMEEAYDAYDQNHLSTSRAEEFSIRIFNALQRVGKVDNIVLVGLTQEQKSFLTFFGDYNVIEIADATDAEHMLTELSGKTEYLLCPLSDVCQGLYNSIIENKLLKIDDQANSPDRPELANQGIAIVEDHHSVSSIISVNYAISAKLNLRIVDPPEANRFEIMALIKEWRETNDQQHLNDLSALLFNRVEQIDFSKYPFATFFTPCSPYSLILKNQIPFSYVNTDLYPDFFIFNNVYRYHTPSLGSAIVFSPLEFKENEETGYVIAVFERLRYSVVQLIDKAANSTNLGYHITEYPYDVLHICSHGGEVSGLNITDKFNDLDGNEHTIEYDEVVGFAAVPGSKLIEVTPIQIWRKLDGLKWKSKELKAKNYHHSLYMEMLKKTHEKKKRIGTKVDRVEGSFSIKCKHFIYQAIFNSIAGTTENPFIFNNTCWSWLGISDSFLSVGASGYVGTLWDVENHTAVAFSESFYDKINGGTILDAFHKSIPLANGTPSEGIYVFWGLHFSKITANDSKERTRLKIASRLQESMKHWTAKIKTEKRERIKDMMESKRYWLESILTTRFRFEHFFLRFFN